MKISRRGFFRLAGGAAAVAVAAPVIRQVASAPLFIPADRLEMGVPGPVAAPYNAGSLSRVEFMRTFWYPDDPWPTMDQEIVVNRHRYAAFRVEPLEEGEVSLYEARGVYDGQTGTLDYAYEGYDRQIDPTRLAEHRRSFADYIDRSHEREIKRLGAPIELTDADYLRAWQKLAEAGGLWPTLPD